MAGADFVKLAFATRYCRDFRMGAAARGLAASSGSAGGAFRTATPLAAQTESRHQALAP